MVMIIVGFIIGSVYLGITIYNLNNKKKQLENIDLSKYTKVDGSKVYVYILIGLMILSVFGVYLGYIGNSSDNISLGIMLIFLSLSEIINTKQLNTYYYNDTHVILNGNVIRYKSIKSLTKVSSFFIKRFKLTTINGDIMTIPVKPALHIQELMKKKR